MNQPDTIEQLEPYTQDELEKMLPEYMALLDAEDEENALNFLKEKFTNRQVDMLKFAGLVATVIEERHKDKSSEASHASERESKSGGTGGDKGEDTGSDDNLEQTS